MTIVPTSRWKPTLENDKPTLENDFNLKIRDEHDAKKKLIWTNPHLNSAITPYIPSEDDKELLAACQAALENVNLNSLDGFNPEVFFTTNDVSVIIFSQVDPQTLSRCTKVSRAFHLVTKNQTIWANQLANFLPNAKPLGSEICIFSTQQQFQIIYKKINDLRKPYYARFDYIKERSNTIMAALKPLNAEFNDLGGNEALGNLKPRFLKIVAERELQNNFVGQCLLRENLKKTDEFRLYSLIDEIQNLRLMMGMLDMNNFTLPLESMQATAYLDQVSNAIEVLIPAAFDQEKFNKTIQQ